MRHCDTLHPTYTPCSHATRHHATNTSTSPLFYRHWPPPSTRLSCLSQPGELVGGRWEVRERIGHGTYSEVYLAYAVHTHARSHPGAQSVANAHAAVALKVDRPAARASLDWEANLLAKLQRYPNVPRFYGAYDHTSVQLQEQPPQGAGGGGDGGGGGGSGGAAGELVPVSVKTRVLAMSLLGPNVSMIRERQPGGQLPLGAALRLAQQMLPAVEALHQAGYIHRDLKPSNFCLGVPKSAACKRLYLLDYGQSRMYMADDGVTVRPARPSADFRGTSLYSSLHAHRFKDLGRRDDLWSLLYVIVDLLRGGVPWRPHKDDRRACELLKEVRGNNLLRRRGACSRAASGWPTSM